MISTVSITRNPLIIEDIRKFMVNPKSGAIVIFEGCSRNNNNNLPVKLLSYEAFTTMAEQELCIIRKKAIERYDLHQCIIYHRIGKVSLTETALIVACSSAHRNEAFKATEWIVEQIKISVPIWKHEQYTDETKAWI